MYLRPNLVGNGYSAVATGMSHTVALKTDGTLWAWGHNFYGQLGDGTTTQRSAPTLVSGGFINWTSVSAGDTYACGVRGGLLYCWGNGGSGQLGFGLPPWWVPQPIVGP